jgi:hypothetical protein
MEVQKKDSESVLIRCSPTGYWLQLPGYWLLATVCSYCLGVVGFRFFRLFFFFFKKIKTKDSMVCGIVGLVMYRWLIYSQHILIYSNSICLLATGYWLLAIYWLLATGWLRLLATGCDTDCCFTVLLTADSFGTVY